MDSTNPKVQSEQLASDYVGTVLELCISPFVFPDSRTRCPGKIIVQSQWMLSHCLDFLVSDGVYLSDINNDNYDSIHADLTAILKICLGWAEKLTGEIEGVQGLMADELPLASRLDKYRCRNVLNDNEKTIFWKGNLLLTLLSLSQFKSEVDQSFISDVELNDEGYDISKYESLTDALDYFHDALIAYNLAEMSLIEYGLEGKFIKANRGRDRSSKNLSLGPKTKQVRFEDQYGALLRDIDYEVQENVKLQKIKSPKRKAKRDVIRSALIKHGGYNVTDANYWLESYINRYNKWKSKQN